MYQITLFVPNALLLVMDAVKRDVNIPENPPDDLTTATASCVAICTQADVDGQVTVRLTDRPIDRKSSGCDVIRRHTISTPNRKLAVVTCENKTILEIDVPRKKADLMIHADHETWATKVYIEVQ
jgi:hypothetical protein